MIGPSAEPAEDLSAQPVWRCDQGCDVEWRGDGESRCWVCGAPGSRPIGAFGLVNASRQRPPGVP